MSTYTMKYPSTRATHTHTVHTTTTKTLCVKTVDWVCSSLDFAFFCRGSNKRHKVSSFFHIDNRSSPIMMIFQVPSFLLIKVLQGCSLFICVSHFGIGFGRWSLTVGRMSLRFVCACACNAFSCLHIYCLSVLVTIYKC